MPRIARVVVAEVPYHVTQRGNYRQNIFEDDEDRAKYMELFMEYKEKHGLKLYAWCLMDNHVHFVIEPSTEKTLGLVFNGVNMRYSQYFNRKRGAYGHLWQGRYFSCALDSDHVYEALRYVELNPLRAGMISKIDGYKWSSAKMRITGKGKFPLDDVSAYVEIENWRAYLKEKAADEVLLSIRNCTKTGRPLGGAKFIKKIERLSGRTISFQKKGRPKKIKLDK